MDGVNRPEDGLQYLVLRNRVINVNKGVSIDLTWLFIIEIVYNMYIHVHVNTIECNTHSNNVIKYLWTKVLKIISVVKLVKN